MKKILASFCFFSLLLAAACVINPVSGKYELSLISEQQEIALGKEADLEIRSQYGVYDSSSLNEYVKKVGLTLAPHTHRPHLVYHYAVLDTPVVNAFALPGGYIYVTRGILVMMNSEAELAAVLAHELGHVNARHSVQRLSKLLLVQIGMNVGSALSETFAQISGVASIGIQLLFLKYSRDDEREADALGVEYARKGSYDPGEMVSFFSSLQKLGDLSGGHSLPGFLSTHPLTSERIQNVQASLIESDRQLMTKPTAYLKSIANIVFGDDPRQGYVEGNTFYHPGLRFSFSFPRDWKLQNEPSQVVLASKDGKAATILQVEKSSENLKDYASRKAAELENNYFINEQSLTINGLNSFQHLYDIGRPEKETLRARITHIKKGAYIFSFYALSTSDDFSKYDFQFGTLVGSFNELRDRSHLNRQPQRLKLIQANGRQTLQQIFMNSGLKKDLWAKMAIMNGMEIDQIPKQNQLVKIVR
jgi:predicted Zn-dependent protease